MTPRFDGDPHVLGAVPREEKIHFPSRQGLGGKTRAREGLPSRAVPPLGIYCKLRGPLGTGLVCPDPQEQVDGDVFSRGRCWTTGQYNPLQQCPQQGQTGLGGMKPPPCRGSSSEGGAFEWPPCRVVGKTEAAPVHAGCMGRRLQVFPQASQPRASSVRGEARLTCTVAWCRTALHWFPVAWLLRLG